jgi:hypothetical protein
MGVRTGLTVVDFFRGMTKVLFESRLKGGE